MKKDQNEKFFGRDTLRGVHLHIVMATGQLPDGNVHRHKRITLAVKYMPTQRLAWITVYFFLLLDITVHKYIKSYGRI